MASWARRRSVFLPAVDDGGVEVRHAAWDARGTGKGQNEARRVVHV